MEETNDCYWLLKEVRAVSLQFNQRRISLISLLDMTMSLYTC